MYIFNWSWQKMMEKNAITGIYPEAQCTSCILKSIFGIAVVERPPQPNTHNQPSRSGTALFQITFVLLPDLNNCFSELDI